jgi:cytochrome c biogenesis protein CcmG/thiol:disulfide interchange protein DsbE
MDIKKSRFKAALLSLLMASLIPVIPARADDLNLGAYKGKVVYLDFWASWCTPCRLSFPWMNQIQALYGREGLVVIGVNVDHDRALADEFLAANRGNFQIAYDPHGDLASKYDVKGMPTSFLIGRDGKVHYVHPGFTPDREQSYDSDVRALLNEKAR